MKNPLYELADDLLGWDVLRQLGFKDVVVDPDSQTVALTGPALKLELSIVKPQFIRNVDSQLNTSFAKHFEIPIEVEKWPNSYRVRQTKPMWFHGETSDNSEGEGLEDFLNNLSDALRDVLRFRGHEIGDEDIRVQLNPDPGYPYYHGTTEVNYSAKSGREHRVGPPVYAIEIRHDGKDQVGVDFCKLLPIVCAGGNALAGRIGGDEFVVTHCTSAWKKVKIDDLYAERVAGCPGMLFPSLATGLIPATNFGETVLVVRPDIVLAGMSPYRKKGAYPAVTFNTDIWTDTLGSFMKEGAIQAYRQLHTDTNWYYSNHLLVLGPEIKETGFGDQDVKPILSTKGLGSAIRKKFRAWKRDLTQGQFDELSERMSGERYGYLETKLHIILGWDCVPLAFAPSGVKSEVESNLIKFGFTGKVIGIDLPEDFEAALLSDKGKKDMVEYQYAWLVRDEILKYAHDKNAIFSVQE